jgi:hypothetical protein
VAVRNLALGGDDDAGDRGLDPGALVLEVGPAAITVKSFCQRL